MAIFETYSKRKKGLPDLYIYTPIEQKLRNQIFHIWNEYLQKSNIGQELTDLAITTIYETILKEEGKKELVSGYVYIQPALQIERYFEALADVEKTLDIIEIVFHYITKADVIFKKNYSTYAKYSSTEAIADLNQRLKENGLGYELSNGQIIRIDSQILHSETIQPALKLLQETNFLPANDEFIKAHEHYRHGRNKECLNECLKAFESTMKIICKLNSWEYNAEKDTAKALIAILLSKSFLPSYNESSLNALKQLLEGSVPTVRNKNSGHGQGTTVTTIPNHLANYMLYITGATIKLLVDTQNLKSPN